MRWVLEYLHFLGLYVKHIVLHFCLYFIALVPLAQSGMSHCLCVWVPFHEPSRFWHSYHNDVGPIWIIDMWVRVWNPERLTNWNPNSEISCVKTGTSFSKLWVSYLFPYWMFCMIKQSQTCFCITSAWLLIFCFMKVQYASIWFTLLTRQDWPDVVIGTFLTILWPPLIWTI